MESQSHDPQSVSCSSVPGDNGFSGDFIFSDQIRLLRDESDFLAAGDIHIDDHHTNEDVALAIGTALLKALGERKGINRFGDFTAPLDEALIHVTLDLSGRPYLGYNLEIPTQRLVEHFFRSLVNDTSHPTACW
ncbi:hypothetical protein AALP_AAs58574U000600 [Arabis alpina]|uniref:imidazoleglycerol-phosphate dehydratase n=1 Tax=Arabis alpina TaxID=50452 RepID=A0A087G1Q6_ARAAL|nr:hypothetical protein AALP_AAs58574U000600 [Arabis alpina]